VRALLPPSDTGQRQARAATRAFILAQTCGGQASLLRMDWWDV